MTDPIRKSADAAPRCGLAPTLLAARIDEWRALAANALRREVASDRVITVYPNRPDIARSLSVLVAAEAECCPFLAFDVQAQGDEISVELRYPPQFAGTLARLLGGAGVGGC